MTELEQLRKEVNELRERLALLEARKDRLEGAEHDRYRKESDALKRAVEETYRAKPTQQPFWPTGPQWFNPQAPDWHRHFPPGTILC
jgi:hypothetical protein